MRIGIELEYWLVDGTGHLAPATDAILACEGVEREFVDPLVEVKTPPCESVEALVTALVDRLDRVRAVAREEDRRLLPLGTPLGDERLSRSSESETRIAVQREILGDDFDHARHCAGTHVHFEQCAPADQLRALTALDPAFALVNTTPYYRGRRVAACARPYAYRRLCYRSLPEHGRLWRYPDSAAEWRERTEQRFERFADVARENGVSRATVESAFSRHDAVWSPVRLRDDLGTVEWRAPDAAPPLDACRLAADVVRLVRRAVDEGTQIANGTTADGGLSLPPFEDVRRRVDRAIERGLAAPSVARHLSRLGFDPGAYDPLGARIGGRARIDAPTARTVRQRCADRLARDVERLRDGHAALVPSDDRPRPSASA